MSPSPIERAQGPGTTPLHRAPTSCPVCGDGLVTLRLGCLSCGTEVSGAFASCAFCRLRESDRQTLEVFLRSRGNMRDVQAHLGVSYPTARQRFAELLIRLGLGEPVPVPNEEEVLADLAAGRITVEQAEELLGGTR
jgi:hypothetical protein